MRREGLKINWWVYIKIRALKNISIASKTSTWWLLIWKTERPFTNLYMASDPTLRCKFNYMNLQPWMKPCRKRCSSTTYLELPDARINPSPYIIDQRQKPTSAMSSYNTGHAMPMDLMMMRKHSNKRMTNAIYAVQTPIHEDHRDVTHMAN